MILTNFLTIFCCFLWLYSCTNYLPRFELVPPPLVYFSEGGDESSKVLTCKAWPQGPLTEVTFYSTQRASDPREQLSKAAPLHPLDKEHIHGSSVVIRNLLQARVLSKLDLHCLAKTSFGAVISRPFRVVVAHIGTFPSTTNSGEARKVVSYFMHGNVAYVDCIPPASYPPAIIEFKLNGTTIHASRRYKYIKRPNSQRVTLLILAFEPRDQGYYRCSATNSITGEIKTDPLVQQLKIRNPESKVPAYVKMTIFGRELPENGISSNPMDVISVREGMNITLFCVMEGAPPPYVTTFKVRNIQNNQNRHISDKDFGFLRIMNVNSDDEDSYLCSETSVSDTVQLKVLKRLSITQRPQDIKVNELGSQARFTCLSNDATITPQWYFNGRIRTQTIQAGKDNEDSTNINYYSSLYIDAVRNEDLGVYQCVARSKDEWVTEVASLSLKGDILISKDEDLNNVRTEESTVVNSNGDLRGSRIKKNVYFPQIDNLTTSFLNEELAPPQVIFIDDNLAVLLKWLPEDNSSEMIRHYRVQYKYQKVNSKLWSPIQSLENEITERFFYVTNRYIQAQQIYIFRISVVLLSSLSRHSQWSKPVSFAHIYPVHPIITYVDVHNNTHGKVRWEYADISIYPITAYKILVRKIIQDGTRDQYSKYWQFFINNPSTTGTFIGPLSPGFRYQVVIYGIKEDPPRKITKYSAEATFKMPAVGISPVTKGINEHNNESNTKLMFIILGSLAGLMMLVIVVLVLMCYCRERKSVVMHRLNRYKDPAKLIHNSEQAKAVQSSFLLASISAAAANANKQQSQQDNNTGEHASLLSTGTDAMYYQQKRQPPSGGSGHDMSDSEGVSIHDQSSMMVMQDHIGIQHHPNMQTQPNITLTITPQTPAITYYKTAPGPASLPAGSLLRPGHHQHFTPQQRYSPGFQYAPQILYTNAGLVYSPGSYVGTMYPHQQQQQQISSATTPRQDACEMRSQDGGESVYSYFSQTSTNNPRQGMHGTVEAGSQTITSNGSAGHRHHRRKRRKTNNSTNGGVSENDEMCGNQPKSGMRHMYVAGGQGQREVMYDTPPMSAMSHQDSRIIGVPPGMVLMQPGGMVNPAEQCWAQMNNTLTRRGTPTLFVEPPRIRDYSEYGIPPQNQMVVGQPQQLAHLSQQNLHLHNQNFGGGYRDGQA